MASSPQYKMNPSWSSSQCDTGQNRHFEPGAAFLGPRLWDQPISLPFQLFPSDSQQQQQDFSKQQSIFTQQQHSSFNQQRSSFQNNNRDDSQNQEIEELTQKFWR